jgi:hypothetical protein
MIAQHSSEIIQSVEIILNKVEVISSNLFSLLLYEHVKKKKKKKKRYNTVIT